jgi:hypothetical protein
MGYVKSARGVGGFAERVEGGAKRAGSPRFEWCWNEVFFVAVCVATSGISVNVGPVG